MRYLSLTSAEKKSSAHFFLKCTDYKLNFYDADYAQLKMEEEYPSELREFIETILEAVRHNGTQTHKISDLYYQFKVNEKYSKSPSVHKMSIKLFSKLIRDYLVEMKIPTTEVLTDQRYG